MIKKTIVKNRNVVKFGYCHGMLSVVCTSSVTRCDETAVVRITPFSLKSGEML